MKSVVQIYEKWMDYSDYSNGIVRERLMSAEWREPTPQERVIATMESVGQITYYRITIGLPAAPEVGS